MHWPDGAKYEGHWRDSYPTGKGRFTHIDEEVFEGPWTALFISKVGSGPQVTRNGFAWLVYKEKMFKISHPEPNTASLIIDPDW
jgi:hypothetical protein